MKRMDSKVITVRLRSAEIEVLDELRNSETVGHLNRTEYIRYLLISEHKRRLDGHRATPWQYSSELRNGRPKEKCNTVSGITSPFASDGGWTLTPEYNRFLGALSGL